MIKVENLSYSFPQKDLYKKITFSLEDGDHCAFIGTNGSGKSTLIDMILNPEKFIYDGIIEKSDNCTIGYVSQFCDKESLNNITVFDYISHDYIKLQNEITSICTEMETSCDIEPLLKKYQEALDALEAINGDEFENIVNKKLNLSGLMKYKEQKICDLSGGEFKLIQVIKAMLNNPNLIIMDEPDVFLDFDNLNALKNLINSHKGTMLIITHNRYLLNNCFNKILHLENMEIQEFNGDYINYNFSLLQTKVELLELSAADTAEIERNDILIDKLREIACENAEAFRGRTLNARVKIQERLMKRRIKAPFIAITEPKISLSTNKTFEDEFVIKVNNLNISFNEPVLENVSFEIKAGDKVAIVGSNGTGKTSLLEEIYKNNNTSIEINENIDIAYISQIQDKTLTNDNTVLEEFFEVGYETREEIQELLNNYGFDSEILKQKIGNLSGGEKAMLQLAKISSSNGNLLLLDEPSSHLDTYSQIALEKAIKNYSGTILMVSHDFYSIVNSMDYVLLVEDKTIRRVRMRTFRKMIYANHFDKDYLEIEQNKKNLETNIELALKDNDFILAKNLTEELEKTIKLF